MWKTILSKRNCFCFWFSVSYNLYIFDTFPGLCVYVLRRPSSRQKAEPTIPGRKKKVPRLSDNHQRLFGSSNLLLKPSLLRGKLCGESYIPPYWATNSSVYRGQSASAARIKDRRNILNIYPIGLSMHTRFSVQCGH